MYSQKAFVCRIFRYMLVFLHIIIFGGYMITIKDIAAILNVSPTTVSNVINGHTEKMSESTRCRVEEALIQYGFRKKHSSNKKNDNLKLVSVDFNMRFRDRIFMDPFCAELLDAICMELRNHGRYPVCGRHMTTDETYTKMSAPEIEGGIVVGFDPRECQAFSQKVGKPVVFIDCGTGPYDNIGIADYKGAKMITNYLLKQGHRKIAFLCDRKLPVSSNFDRFQGYCDALGGYGISYSNNNYYYLPSDDNLKRERMRELAMKVKTEGYTAVFVVSDLLANEVISVFLSEGLRVPDDISVTGFDDNIYARLCNPELTTVRQPVYEKGIQAVKLLMQRIMGEEVLVNSFCLPVELIVRDSVKNIN